jgi:speckle-type POZ protein
MDQSGAVSASLSTTTMISTLHLFHISGYSITKELPTGKCIMSSPFLAGGYRWAIRYYPNGIDSYQDPGIAFTLQLQSEGTGIKVRLKFCLMDSNGRPSEVHSATSFCEFQYESCDYGFSGFITHGELEESGYLKDDSFVVRCTVSILDSNVVETSASCIYDAVQDQLPPSDLHEQLRNLLQGGEGADVTFNVGGQIFSAHRCILSARSPVFRAQFFGPMRSERFNDIEVDDMEPMVFKVLLHYLYTDLLPEWDDISGYSSEKRPDSAIMAQHLLAAADRYSLERLKMICAQKLSQTISTDTVATTLALAEQHDCALLKAVCIRFISTGGNLKEVLATDGFRHLMLSCPSIFDEILANIADPFVLRDLVIRFSKIKPPSHLN